MRPSSTAIGERERNRGGRRVAVPVDGGDDLRRGDAELVRRAVDDALVGLMRHEPVDVVGGVAGRLERVLDHVGDHRRRRGGTPLGLPCADARRCRSRTARHRHRAWSCAGRRSADATVSMPRSSRVPGCSCASITTAPAPSPNSTQVPRSVQSRMREKVSAPITSARLYAPDLQQAIGGRQRIDEAGADRLQVEGGAVGDAERRLHRDGARRKGVVGRRGGEHDQVDRLRIDDARARAPRARRAQPRSEVSSPAAAMWRSWMPVRCTIHSSEVSTLRARSALVRTWLGR